MKVNVINNSRHPLPEYKTKGSAGMDLYANLETSNHIQPIEPLERRLIRTGLFMEIPEGYEGNIRPRSGLSLKVGIVAIEGTIDSDYRGEVGVILTNLSNITYNIVDGERIAQMVFNKIEQAEFNLVSELSETERGEGGFGSTGNK